MLEESEETSVVSEDRRSENLYHKETYLIRRSRRGRV